jgi:phosphoribosyl 1,2-cyclic phosphodiesterase
VLNVLALNALRKEPEHYSHFTLSQALEIIDELNPKKAYLGFAEKVFNQLFLSMAKKSWECWCWGFAPIPS